MPQLSTEIEALLQARSHDPFAVLGHTRKGRDPIIRVYNPAAESIQLVPGNIPMHRIGGTDLFECRQLPDIAAGHYRLKWQDKSGNTHENHDPYDFPPQIPDFDIHLFGEGRHWHLYRILGAHPREVDNIAGVLFATWAPNAQRVSVVGSFNQWDGRRHPMRQRGNGIWELFVPDTAPGELYKFEILSRDNGTLQLKTDPYGQQFEVRPANSSVVRHDLPYFWQDAEWMENRTQQDWLHAPMSVYEVHLGSWQRNTDGSFLGYRELAEQICNYVKETGYTHVELLPVTEHPLDASWGYQTTGYFAPTSRHGCADDFRFFIDHMHQHGIGVILDWVPAHFPKDAHGLARFDGTALYEHADPRQGEHRDWGTHIYNYGRNEVRNFLLASAMFWLEEFHLDGLRVDAVASMLYLDYSREAHDWVPNYFGGNENLEAIEFLKELNTVVHQQHPGALVIAEESTAWPQVTRPTWTGGLGFSMKWNMGWMHDSLQYMSRDPVHRTYHHDKLSFGLLYSFNENFVLPFSHDEVVHGKQPMIYKMPGDEWQKFANLRLLYTYMFTYPGKKLLFMGCDFAQTSEWNHDMSLSWHLLQYPLHQGIKTLVTDLNRIYRGTGALHVHDFEPQGFEWIDCHDSSRSVLSYLRRDDHGFVVVVLNFTPVPREHYRLGVPLPGKYREIINSDSLYYGGSNMGNGEVGSCEIPWMNRDHSIEITLPPLGALVLEYHS